MTLYAGGKYLVALSKEGVQRVTETAIEASFLCCDTFKSWTQYRNRVVGYSSSIASAYHYDFIASSDEELLMMFPDDPVVLAVVTNSPCKVK